MAQETVDRSTRASDLSPDVRRIVTSVGISALGTWSYNVGIAVYAYQETGSTAWVAAATVGRYVPALLITWVGSRWADRFPRRNVAVVSDCLCAGLMLLLTVVAAMHGPILLAIALAALSSGIARIQSAAALSAAADLVPESQLARAAVLLSSTESAATAIGPALASVVLLVSGPPAVFALNGITFAVSALLIAGVRRLPPRPSIALSGGDDRATDDAYRQTRRVVWPLLATRTIAAVVYGVDVVLLAVVATEQLKQGTTGYGWLLAAAGAGGVLAAWLLRNRDSGGRTAARATSGLALYTVPLLGFLALPLLGASMAIQSLRGIGCVLVTATVVAGLQRSVPSSVSARIFGLSHILVMLGTSAGALITPVLLGAWGLSTTVVIAGLVPMVAALLLLPALVRFDRRGAATLAALDPRVDLLRSLSLFHDASRSTLYEVADEAAELVVPDGTRVITQGETADRLYVLVEGTMRVTQARPEGDGPGAATLRTLSAPAYFGEIGLLHAVPRTATVTAEGPCVVWGIEAASFLGAVGQAGMSGALSDTVSVRLSTGHGRGNVIAVGTDL